MTLDRSWIIAPLMPSYRNIVENTTKERFITKFTKTDNCWIWEAAKNRGGYGVFRMNKRTCTAHRLAYTTFVGPIPKGLDIDHLCRNRACVNPDHMEPVTRGENTRRGDAPKALRAYKANITECPSGHPYDEINTYYRKDRPGRECRTCRTETSRRIQRAKNETSHARERA